jgi:pimeloyl-ACP methyl ester carboxylesterase
MTPVVAFAPGWSLWDIHEFLEAPDYAEAATFEADADYDARALGPDFKVPFFIINGALDNITPASLARNYFDFVRAPYKEFIVIPNAGHSAVLTQPDIFLHSLRTRVRPIAIQNENGVSHG